MRGEQKIAIAVAVAGLALSACSTAPVTSSSAKSSATASAGLTAAGQPFKPFPIYTDRLPRHTHYAPSGYMGDSDLTMSGSYVPTPDGQGPCLKINYKGSGAKGWSGIYWQDPANNWGDVPGRAGYDLRGATRLSFWARGENGGERVHEFRVGGIVGQYPDSDVASLSNVKLTKDWKEYSIDLTGRDLRHIIGGFGFMVNKADNPGGMVFYIDDIMYLGKEGATPVAVVQPSTPTVTTPLPAPTTAQATPPPAPAPPVPESKDLKVKQVDAGLRVSFSSQFLFASGQAVLQPESAKILDQVIALLNAYPQNGVLIEGHTDSTGNPDYNQKLSQLRAEAVRNYLVKHGGYDEKRFKVVGYGATHPVANNATKAGRALNRRVEVTILKTGPTP